jgi:hypothetical protein
MSDHQEYSDDPQERAREAARRAAEAAEVAREAAAEASATGTVDDTSNGPDAPRDVGVAVESNTDGDGDYGGTGPKA